MINRNIYKSILILISIVILFNGCSTSQQITKQKNKKETSTLLNQDVMAVLWYQRAAETRALYYQAYNVAKDRLKDILKTDTSKKKKAVVVDIDETVLNNSPYQAMNIMDNVNYPTGWKQWIRSEKAKATPGSINFLKFAVKHNVDVYYVTNRSQSLESATLENLKKLGFPQAVKSHLFLKTNTSDKTKRRNDIRKTHQIVLLCGDNLGDFSQIFQHHTSKKRNALVNEYKSQFGRKFIILPNPMYGEWEGATYHYNYDMSAGEKVEARKKALNYFHINDK